jgi:hypothetical protein
MKKLCVIIIFFCIAVIAGCSYLKTTRTSNLKSYTLNVDDQSTTGVPMITAGHITYATATGKHELSEEQDNWTSYEYETGDNFKEELVYEGRSGNTIHFLYKKYIKILSHPSSSENLTFDLDSSDTVAFRNYKIKVLNATKEYIKFRVISD